MNSFKKTVLLLALSVGIFVTSFDRVIKSRQQSTTTTRGTTLIDQSLDFIENQVVPTPEPPRDWRSVTNSWAVRSDGLIEIRGKGVPRSKTMRGKMRTVLGRYQEEIQAASTKFAIPIEAIAAMIAVECGSLNPECHRVEPSGVQSVGLMQTLIKTADSTNKKLGIYRRPGGEPLRIILKDLQHPRVSIMLGTAYMDQKRDQICASRPSLCDDWVAVQAAYNAGALKPAQNEWGMRMHKATRATKYIQAYNEAVALVSGHPQPTPAPTTEVDAWNGTSSEI